MVIHAAAAVDDRGESQFQINVDGTRLIARACREHGVQRLVHISSVAAIGIPPYGTIADELFPFNLANSGLTYHLSKKRAEEAVFEEIGRGLDAVIVNPAYVFGRHGSSFRGSGLIQKARRRRAVPYLSGGVCIVHVSDVVAGVIAALHHGNTGERYILGGDNLTYKDLARQSASAFGLRPWLLPLRPVVTGAAATLFEAWGKIRSQPPRFTYALHRWGRWNLYYSSAKARRLLGYQSRPFSSILRECIEFGGPNPCVDNR
jgi:dihydroflavonol-4-reductase